jgi:hypothetical protein
LATVKANTQPLMDPFCPVAAPPEMEAITVDFGSSQGTPAATPET